MIGDSEAFGELRYDFYVSSREIWRARLYRPHKSHVGNGDGYDWQETSGLLACIFKVQKQYWNDFSVLTLLIAFYSVFLPRLQVVPGNDQNTSPTNQKTAGSNLERTS